MNKHTLGASATGPLLAFCLLLALAPLAAAQQRFARYVDPFVGTGGHGHTYPGATVPFGMMQLSPDTRLTGWDGCSGYHYSDSVIYGFSHTHLSGTGVSDYGDILLTPTVGPIFLNATNGERTDKGYASRFSHRSETASPGYYAVRLDDENIGVELTTTKRAGLHRYTYPASEQSNIILDLTHRDRVLDSALRVVGDNRIEGYRRSEAWARDQVVYFVAEFSVPFTASGIALDERLTEGLREARGENVKAFFRFRTRQRESVLVRVGISAVDIEGARRNLAAEIDHWDFERVKREAAQAWEQELGKIEVAGGTEAQLKNFYTAMYHSMLAPNLFMDVDNRYRGRDLKTHTARGFTNYTVFSLWDTFRAAHPLYTIIDQRRTRDYINTFLAQYEQGGRLPVWELAANETECMIGYHAVSVLADAALKGIEGFDKEKALAAMKHSAELEHFGLAAYKRRGYIGMEDEPESVSKTLEYAYDDWCIAQMARLLGREKDYRLYTKRAQFYKNVFDPETGYMRPKKNAGWVAPFDPREVTFNFTEANSWQYSFFVPQDVSGLMSLLGGRERFADKLDALFSAESRTLGREQADITGLIGQYAHGNEPSHHMAYLYNYAGQPWKTQGRVRQIMDEFYRPTPDGLIGNEDCGQMSAWYILSAAGFYPVTPGAPLYAIGSPLFADVRFRLENGHTFRIRTHNNAPANRYIQSATLNGRPFTKSYLRHEEIMRGGELVFRMGARPNREWGTGDGNVPVSSIEGVELLPAPAINAAKNTFRGRMQVSLKSATAGAQLFYTTDGAEPDNNSTRYAAPFYVERSTTVKAVAVEAGGLKSLTSEARFQLIPNDWAIKLLSKYSRQYTAGGDEGLIDGVRGTTHFSGGAWQGFQGQDFEAVVDLGRVEAISKLGAGFLQNVGSWILMPTRVEFALSVDGARFDTALTIGNDVPDRDRDPVIKDFVRTIPAQRARYVKVKAYNYGKLPSWHLGAGGDAYIFIDEIIIE
ncbi:MAG TPA: GH92 family glycosyl hydrolase [Pyrinomonadaceae bacterium]|nr:GH92 family glycosyl hydrolase [Pyrinomonadaceae bacterium]